MTFKDYATAARMRDAIKRVTKDVLAEERPDYRYATVTSVDSSGTRAWVTYSGEALAVPVRLGSHRPLVGNVVRVGGKTNDRHVTDVVTADEHKSGGVGSTRNPTFKNDFAWWAPWYNGALDLEKNAWQIAEVNPGDSNYFIGDRYVQLYWTGALNGGGTGAIELLTGDKSSSPIGSIDDQIPVLRDVALHVTAWVGKRGNWGNYTGNGIRLAVRYYDRDGNHLGVQASAWTPWTQVGKSLADTDAGNLSMIGARFRVVLSGASLRDAVYCRAGIQVDDATTTLFGDGTPASGQLVVGQITAEYDIWSEFLSYHHVTVSGTTSIPNTTWTKVNWTVVRNDGGWGSGVDLLCPMGGIYVVTAFTHWGANASRGISNLALTSGTAPSESNSYSRSDDSLEGGTPMQVTSAIISPSTGTPLNLFLWNNYATPSYLGWTSLQIGRVA